MKQRFSESDLGSIIIGLSLITFSPGGIYSIKLVKYGYFILTGGTFILISSTRNFFNCWFSGKEIKGRTAYLGLAASFLIALFFGIQSPHVPYKHYILLIGIILILYALNNFIRRGKIESN